MVGRKKLTVNAFKWVEKLLKFNEKFMKSYNENSHIGSFAKVPVEYPKELYNPHKDLLFSPGRKKLEKVKQLVCSREEKKNVFHKRALKQALNNGLILKTVHRLIQFNQKMFNTIH